MAAHTRNIATAPRLLFRPDPVIGWSLTPGFGVKVGFRRNTFQNIGTDGWRCVPRPSDTMSPAPDTEPKVAIYGCSFTYGTGSGDNKTFTGRLQRDLPNVRVVNRRVGGHNTVQNLFQFRRNIAHPQRMRQYRDWYRLGVEQVPVVRLDAAGRRAQIIYRSIWQPVLRAADSEIFLPDDYLINSATLAVLDLLTEAVGAAGVPLRFVPLDAPDPGFANTVRGQFPDTIDFSTPLDQDHTFLPRNNHPNMIANTLFADRIPPVVAGPCDALQAGDHA
jgi:hypothetical protein